MLCPKCKDPDCYIKPGGIAKGWLCRACGHSFHTQTNPPKVYVYIAAIDTGEGRVCLGLFTTKRKARKACADKIRLYRALARPDYKKRVTRGGRVQYQSRWEDEWIDFQEYRYRALDIAARIEQVLCDDPEGYDINKHRVFRL